MKKYVLHVGRFSNQDGTFTESKPCRHCLDLLKKVGIRKIVYTTETGCVKAKVSSLTSEHRSMAYRQLQNYCSV